MLNRKTLVSIIAIVCCADMAFGAASLRIGGTQNATGTTARAGTLRTGSVKLAGVTPKSSVSGGTATPTTIGRLATSTGGSSVGNSHGRISGHGSGASAAALDELERRVNALADDYGRLDGQYDRLSNDVNYAATTATSANTGINNLRTRVDTVEGKITGLENQGVDTATINGLIDDKIGNFPTKNEVTTQINTASEALMDYADSTGMTETERQELTRLSSAVDTKLSIADAENTYATKTQLNNAIVGNESVLADYVQTTYANAHFATKPEVNTLSERVDSAATSVNSLNAMVSDQATVVTNANNKVTALENAVVALDNAVSDKVGVTTYNNLVTEVSNALGGKADQSVVNGLDARITANASTIAEHTNALADRVTSTQLSQAIADVQAGNVDESTINAMIQNALGENTTFVTTSTYTGDKETINAQLTQHGNKINALENKDDSLTASVNALQLANESITTALNNKVDATYVTNKINEAQLGGGDVDLSDYYTKPETDALLANKINTETANATFETQTHATLTYADKETTENALSQLNTDMANKVTAAQVSAAIAQAQLDGSDVDLSDYYTKPETDALLTNKVTTDQLQEALSQIDTPQQEDILTLQSDVQSLQNKDLLHDSEIAALQTADTTMNNKITDAENNISALSTNLANNYYNTAEVDAKLLGTTPQDIEAMVQNAVGGVLANKVDTSTYEAHVTAANASIDSLTGKITTAESDIDTLEETVGSHTTSIASLEQNKLDKDDAVLNKITTNETNIAALQTADTTLSNKITAAEDNIDTLGETVGSHTTSIASLEQNKLDKDDAVLNKITTNETNIAALQTANTTMSNKITSVEETVGDHTTTISNINTTLPLKADKTYVDSEILKASTGGIGEDDIRRIVGEIVDGSTFVTQSTYDEYTTATDNALATMNNKITENTNGIATLTTEVNKKANQTALETAQATLTAAIATAEQSAKNHAEEYTNQKVAAGVCPNGTVEVVTRDDDENGGKVYIVNCVQSD